MERNWVFGVVRSPERHIAKHPSRIVRERCASKRMCRSQRSHERHPILGHAKVARMADGGGNSLAPTHQA